jgi:DNA-directed RNA polymerase subunit RPC12/RpoP
MGFHSCPGSKIFKDVRPEYLGCPHCGKEIELWSDELVVRCKNCGNYVSKRRGASCIDWCRFARECVGAQKYARLQQEELQCQTPIAEPAR